ncbi:unnamed protein product [Caenorhabditis auriculariae]|uniref:AB hydrolase-1 domain-containing protein n=1 Tax=Caenorhabditis auriculariae TaxID=2777116 RepID=A0A8S1GNI1_9PELO|nr:unnamed protein product [Caenorhabditis auriculariae]
MLEASSNVLNVLESLPVLIETSTFFVWFFSFAFFVRFLHIFSTTEPPRVTYTQKCHSEIRRILEELPILQQPYRPPLLWGRSGHIQTAAYGILGHVTLRRSADQRVSLGLSDGSTVTFDIYEPLKVHQSGHDVTLALTPGIANSSESNYIRTCVHYAQENGFRCVVLNHIGAIADVQVTGNRIFTYGGIEELTIMMAYMMDRCPKAKFINIGFSMGGNITTRYLVYMPENHRDRVLLGLSVCQGYSATNSTPMYHDWENGRRAYNYMITENMKRLLRRNYEEVVKPYVLNGLVDEQKLWSCTSIIALDEYYSRKITGHSNLPDFYASVDCLPILDQVQVPMVFLNAEDDPIVPKKLWEPVKSMAADRVNLAFISCKHGGHLGFLEGSSLAPNSITWIDRFIIQLANQSVLVCT